MITKSAETPELLSCPFCGGKPHRDGKFIGCSTSNCPAVLIYAPENIWNTRADLVSRPKTAPDNAAALEDVKSPVFELVNRCQDFADSCVKFGYPAIIHDQTIEEIENFKKYFRALQQPDVSDLVKALEVAKLWIDPMAAPDDQLDIIDEALTKHRNEN